MLIERDFGAATVVPAGVRQPLGRGVFEYNILVTDMHAETAESTHPP